MSGRMAGSLLVAGLAACGGSPPAGGAAVPSGASRVVRTVAVERTDGRGETAVPAAVAARQRASLAARIPSSVVALPFRVGERVAKGAIVARMDEAALRSGLAAAESSAHAADTDLARVEALSLKNAATRREAEEARARAAAGRAAVLGAREALGFAVLRAPFDGVVVARSANVGDIVSPGAALVEIEGDSGLELRATVDPLLVSQLRPGLAVEADVDGQAEPIRAAIRSVSPSADPVTHRFEVKADLPSVPGLRSGLFARLRVPSAPGSPRLLVPSSAVFPRGGLSGVFVVEEGRARLRWIAAGASDQGRTEVRAGLIAGERVAADPDGLADGMAVAEAR